MSTPSERHKTDRVAIACRPCRLRKVRCELLFSLVVCRFPKLPLGSGGHPCRHCARLTIECTYAPKQRRTRTKNRRNLGLAADHTDDVKDVVLLSDDDEASGPSEERASSSVSAEHTITVLRGDSATQSVPGPSNFTSPSRASRSQGLESSLGPSQSRLLSAGAFSEKTATLSPAGISISDASTTPMGQRQPREGSSVQLGDACVWLSACSNAGIAWVCETTASRTFAKMAERFGRGVEECVPTSSWPGLNTARDEPSEETAWEYVNGECSHIEPDAIACL